MTITPQKEALYSVITSRAALYQTLFRQQRENAAPEAIDQTLAALTFAESEIRRLSDEVNGAIWYQNYNATFETLHMQGATILGVLGELRSGQSVLQAEFHTVGETVNDLAAQLDGIVASIVEVRAQAAERTREIYARLDAHNDKLSSQEEAFTALRDAVHRLESQLADLHKQTLGDVLSRERRLELTKNNESIPDLWNETRANTAAIERLQRDVAEIGRLLRELHHRMESI